MIEKGFTKGQIVYLGVKRLFDVIISFFALLILMPFFILVALLIKCTSKGPVFFLQRRVGRNKKVFHIVKFRTMRVGAPEIPPSDMTEEQQKALLTKIGGFLRKTSIDELPQFMNILIGQMSLIGPRPAAAINEDKIINERDKCFPSPNSIRPGLSGYAQTHGRNHEVKQKTEMDHYYTKNVSFKLDFIIFFLTIRKLFLFEGK